MSYTEYLDIIVRNSRQLGVVDDRIQRIRDNLEAISGRPLQAAVGTAQAPPRPQPPTPAGRDFVRRESALAQRERLRPTTPTRPLARPTGPSVADVFLAANDAMAKSDARVYRRVGKSIQKQKAGLNELEALAESPGRTVNRGRRLPPSAAGGGGGGNPPRGPSGPLPGTIARESRLRTANQQFAAQQLAANQVGGNAIRIAEETAELYRTIGGRQTQDLDALTAIGRETRAGAERQRRTNQNRNSRQLGIGERGDLLRRSRDIVSRLPEGRQEEVRRRVTEGLLANRRALREGRTVAARFERDRVRQVLRREERGLAEGGRAETRARVPSKASRLADRAETLAARANQIDIQKGTPLGDELFGKAADIASAATKQKNALRKSVVSGKVTTKSVNEATDSLAELQSAFDTLKVRAGGMQRTAKEAAAKAKAQNAEGLRIGKQNTSPVRGGAGFAGSPKLLEDTARRNLQEGLRIGRQNVTRLSDAKNIPGSAAFAKRQQQEFDAQVRANEKSSKAAVDLEKQKQASLANEAKAQREGVSLGSFKKNIGRVFGGGGDTQDFESLALGAGFPLLFGGGPGSVAGGLLGSFVGKGFGGQILGGAIGQIVDDLVSSTARLGNALNNLTGDFSALRSEGVRVSAAVQLQAQERKAAGDFAGASAQIRADVARGQVEGTGVEGLALDGVTAQVNGLSAAWDRVYKTVGLTVGIIASPFLAAVSLVLEIVNGTFREINGVAEGLAQLLNLIPGAADFGKFVSQSAFESTASFSEQLAAIQATNDELVRRGVIEQGIDAKRTAASGLTGASKVLADAQIASAERRLALEEEVRKIREDAPLNEKLSGKTAQTAGIKEQQFLERERQEAARTEIAAAAAALQTSRERQDRERSLNRETEALIRREEDLGNARIDQARQEFDFQRSIADFRIKTEDQIASKRADLARQELEIAKIRGQIEDSRIGISFDRQAESAPNDRAAQLINAQKQIDLAQKDLERTIRDGRTETALKIDQIERSSRQEQRALENERIALERQRDSVIRSRVSLERQTEDLKRDTADYQLNVARQIEDSAIRAANELKAAAAGLLGGLGGGANLGGLGQEVLAGFDRIKGATSFRTKGTSNVRGAISPNGGNEYFDFNGATREAVASRIAAWTKADWVSAINTALGEGKPGADVYNVIANIAARSAKEPSSSVADLVTRPQQYVANAKQGLNINNISDPAFGKKLFGARFDELFKRVGGGSSAAPSIPYGGMVGQPIEYLTGDRNFRGNGKNIRYDEAHGGSNYHEHIAYKTTAERDAAMALLKANGIKIGSVNDGRHTKGSYHYSDQAFDVPASQVPPGQEQELSRRVRAILGIQQGARASSAALPGVSVGTAPFDLKAQAARDAQLQKERQRAEEDSKRQEKRRAEEEFLKIARGEEPLARKREELVLATRIADAGLQASSTEQQVLELRIASVRNQEILTEKVKALGTFTKERAEALAAGLASEREQLVISEALLKVESARRAQEKAREIGAFGAGLKAGYRPGSGAASVYEDMLRSDGADTAKAFADAQVVLDELQQAMSDAQQIGGSIAGGFRDALTTALSGGDVQQVFASLAGNLGGKLIEIATRPLEDYLTKTIFNLLDPSQARQDAAAAIMVGVASQQLMAANIMLQAVSPQTASGGGGGNLFSKGLGLVGSLVGGGLFSGAGAAGLFSGPGLSTDTITSLFSGALSFAGGGSTGSGSRSGGIDGMGGFPAILHPQEVVTDLHGGISAARGRMEDDDAEISAARGRMEAVSGVQAALAQQMSNTERTSVMQEEASLVASGKAGNALKVETIRAGKLDVVTEAQMLEAVERAMIEGGKQGEARMLRRHRNDVRFPGIR